MKRSEYNEFLDDIITETNVDVEFEVLQVRAEQITAEPWDASLVKFGDQKKDETEK